MSSFDHLGFTLLRVFFENPPILLRKKGTFSEEDQKKSKRKLPSAFVNFVRRPSVCAQASVQLWVKASIIFLSRWLSLSKSPQMKNFHIGFKNNLDSYGIRSGVEKIIFLYHEFCLLPSTSSGIGSEIFGSLSQSKWNIVASTGSATIDRLSHHRQAQPPSTGSATIDRFRYRLRNR